MRDGGPKMSRFTRHSTKRALLTIAAEYAIIAGAIAITAMPANEWPVTALAILIIGTRQYALSEALLHEASHWHLSNSKRVNDFLGSDSRVAGLHVSRCLSPVPQQAAPSA